MPLVHESGAARDERKHRSVLIFERVYFHATLDRRCPRNSCRILSGLRIDIRFAEPQRHVIFRDIAIPCNTNHGSELTV